MFQQIRAYLSTRDRFFLRGIIYSCIACSGLVLEIYILKQRRPFLLFGYGLVLVLGLVFLFFLREKER